jgi:hypothetical protein
MSPLLGLLAGQCPATLGFGCCCAAAASRKTHALGAIAASLPPMLRSVRAWRRRTWSPWCAADAYGGRRRHVGGFTPRVVAAAACDAAIGVVVIAIALAELVLFARSCGCSAAQRGSTPQRWPTSAQPRRAEPNADLADLVDFSALAEDAELRAPVDEDAHVAARSRISVND